MDNAVSLKTEFNKRRRRRSLEKRRARSGYFFVAPFLVGIVFVYFPILLDSILLSFSEAYSIPLGEAYRNVGFANYKAVFASPGFVSALLSGLQQIIFEVPAVIIFSLFIAVVLNGKMLGRAAFRAIFFVPVIISTGLMESINGSDIFSDSATGGIDDGSGTASSGGIINLTEVEALFKNLSVGGQLVTYVVNLVNDIYNIINYSGVQMLIFLAGLQSISPSIYEACRIDGATGWETFWKITFPMISPMILVNAVYTVIDSFTRTTNPTMAYITLQGGTITEKSAMYWIYFIIIILIIAVVSAVASTFIFYQRRD